MGRSCQRAGPSRSSQAEPAFERQTIRVVCIAPSQSVIDTDPDAFRLLADGDDQQGEDEDEVRKEISRVVDPRLHDDDSTRDTGLRIWVLEHVL